MRLRALAPVLLLALGACEPTPERPRRPTRPTRRPAVSARSPSAVESLVPEVDASLPAPLARCLARAREGLSPTLSDALESLDAPGLLEDACRLELSARTRDPALCAAVHLSALRERCESRAAIAQGEPDRCPRALGLRGRDPVCVAVAARSPRMCELCVGDERPRCLALALGQPARCDAVSPEVRPLCRQEQRALADTFAPLRAVPRPTLEVTLSEAPAGDASLGADAGAALPLPALSRGVWRDTAGALWIVDPSLGWPDAIPVGGTDTLVSARFDVAAARRGSAPAEARLILPGRVALDTSEGTLTARATLRSNPSGRGERAVGEVTLVGSATGERVGRVLRFDALVRDVVPADDLR